MSILNFILGLLTFNLNNPSLTSIGVIIIIIIVFLAAIVLGVNTIDKKDTTDELDDNYDPYIPVDVDDATARLVAAEYVNRPNIGKTIIVSKDLGSEHPDNVDISLVKPKVIAKPKNTKELKESDSTRWIRIEKQMIAKSMKNLGMKQKVSDLTHSELEAVLKEANKIINPKASVVYSLNTLAEIAKEIGVSAMVLGNYFNRKPVSDRICDKIEIFLHANTKNRILKVRI